MSSVAEPRYGILEPRRRHAMQGDRDQTLLNGMCSQAPLFMPLGRGSRFGQGAIYQPALLVLVNTCVCTDENHEADLTLHRILHPCRKILQRIIRSVRKLEVEGQGGTGEGRRQRGFFRKKPPSHPLSVEIFPVMTGKVRVDSVEEIASE